MQIVNTGFRFCDEICGHTMLNNIESAGRTCYQSYSASQDTPENFVRMLIQRGHFSVLEHESISVRIVCDRGVSHEIVRHRLASYSQESTRYCNYAKNSRGSQVTFIDPRPHMTEVEFEMWREAMTITESYYLNLVNIGVKPEMARSVLPNSLKTEIVMTCNLREWRHFFKMRTSRHAHPQMRELARKMLVGFRSKVPVVFDDIGQTSDGASV